ncbi:MAG: DUF4294 domain-containing protein [Chitinophagales bacterium]|nr:DUF4294 domain-containing protein [Chitinophagales bacterium]MDW8419314.1 DUF4294 domain-containing protein [Chitinophagales bacterium]
MKRQVVTGLMLLFAFVAVAQGKLKVKPSSPKNDEIKYADENEVIDTFPTINLNAVQVVSFKTPEEWEMYYKYKSRIIKVMPYVKIAKQLYNELIAHKENNKKRVYRRYRKDLEKEMRDKFENELKNLTTGQGEMLFKLINRETGNNCYFIIKEIKGGANAWAMQILAKRWGYDLKQEYDPNKEKMIELIIQELGPAYNVNG